MPTLEWPLQGAPGLFPAAVAQYGRIAPVSGHMQYDSTNRIYYGQAPATVGLVGPPTSHLTAAAFPGAAAARILPVFRGVEPEQTFASVPGSTLSLNTAARGLGPHYLELTGSDGLAKGGTLYVVARDIPGRPDPLTPGTDPDSDFHGFRLGRMARVGAIRVSLQTNEQQDPADVVASAIWQAQKLIDYHLYEDPARWGSAGVPLVVNLPYYTQSTPNVVASLAALMAALPSSQHVWLEAQNEPGGRTGFIGSSWGSDLLALRAQADATGYGTRIHLIGPATVNFTPATEAGWDEQFDADVLAVLDGTCAHAYQHNPSWRSAKDTAERMYALRQRHGLAGVPHFNTEIGDESEDYGAGMYGHQAARTMASLHFHVVMGGAPETLFPYRLQDGGSTDYRGYYSSFSGVPAPVVAGMLEMAAQLAGTVPFRHQTDGPTPLTYSGFADEVLSAWTARRADGTGTTHVLSAVPISSSMSARYTATGAGSVTVRAWDGRERTDVTFADGVLTIPGSATDHHGLWIELGADMDIAPLEDCLAVG